MLVFHEEPQGRRQRATRQDVVHGATVCVIVLRCGSEAVALSLSVSEAVALSLSVSEAVALRLWLCAVALRLWLFGCGSGSLALWLWLLWQTQRAKSRNPIALMMSSL